MEKTKLYDFDDIVLKAKAGSILRKASLLPIEVRKQILAEYDENISGLKALDDMKKIIFLIDDFFKDPKEYSTLIEQFIMEMPQERDISPYEREYKSLEDAYWNRVFKYLSYGAFTGKLGLITNKEVLLQMIDMVHYKTIDLICDLNIPHDLYTRLIEYNNIKNPKFVQSKDIMVLIYAYESGLIKSNDNAKINRLSNEINQLNEEKKKIDKGLKVIKSIKTALAASIPILLSIGLSALIPRENEAPATSKAFIYSDDKYSHEERERGEGVLVEEYNNSVRKSYAQSAKYVTVFSDTVDGVCNIKIYDYTGTSLSDEELKSIELSNDNLVVDENVNINDYTGLKVDSDIESTGIHEGQYIKDLGYYTGHAHRDISSVRFEYDGKIWGIFMGASIIYGFSIAPILISSLKGPKEKREQILRDIIKKNRELDKALLEDEINKHNEQLDIKALPVNDTTDDIFRFGEDAQAKEYQSRKM